MEPNLAQIKPAEQRQQDQCSKPEGPKAARIVVSLAMGTKLLLNFCSSTDSKTVAFNTVVYQF